MASIDYRSFQFGLDARKSKLESLLGTLLRLENAQINEGGEIEKRKRFQRIVLPVGTFGAQSVGSSIVTFGSAAPGDIDLTGVPAGVTVTYQRLQHPAVVDGAATYDAADHAMAGVLFSTVFGTEAAVIAEFADGNVFMYVGGEVVRDFFSGRVMDYMDNNVKIAQNIVTLIDQQGQYNGTQITFASTAVAWAAGTATLTIASTTGLVVGMKVVISGFAAGFAGYNGLQTLTGVAGGSIAFASADFGSGAQASTVTSPLVLIAAQNGEDFAILTEKVSAAGSFGSPVVVAEHSIGNPGASAVGFFKVTGGRYGTAASATLTSTGVNPAAATSVTIGTKVYTFVAAITNVEGQVKIGGDADATMENLVDAINHDDGAGSQYYCQEAHPQVTAGTYNTVSKTFTVTARIGGTHGNAIAKAETSAQLSWDAGGGGTFLSGGLDTGGNQVTSIKVVSPLGVEVELLQLPGGEVSYQTTLDATCEAIVTAINAYTDTSTYSAEREGNLISIYSAVAANPQPNNYDVKVTATGNVCIGDCYFFITPTTSSMSITALLVDGVDILGANIALASMAPRNMTTFYKLMETQINAETLSHGYNACAHASYIQISKRVTVSSDPLAVVTPEITNGVATFTEQPPDEGGETGGPTNPNALAVSLDKTGFVTDYANQETTTVTATVTGGTPPYSYDWLNAYNFPYANGVIAALTVNYVARFFSSGGGVTVYQSATALDNKQAATRIKPPFRSWRDGRQENYTFRLRVKDAAGNEVLSEFFTLTYIQN